MKKTISIVLVFVMILIMLISCSNKTESDKSNIDNSDVETTNVSTSFAHETIETTITKNIETNETIETTIIDTQSDPDTNIDKTITDPISKKYGEYLTIVYNEMYCDIDCQYESELGFKEKYIVSIKMKNGYIFDGFTFDKLMTQNVNQNSAKPIKDDIYTFSLDENKVLYANYSMKVIYHGCGGKIDGQDIKEDTFSLSMYKVPSTLPNKNNIIREGYVLTGYNTQPDFTGDSIGIGSKCYADTSTLHLYCEWTKESNIEDFEYKKVGIGCQITKYNGNEKIVCVPNKIDNITVTSIGSKAFENSSVEKIILPLKVTSIYANAFENSKNLKTIECYDNISSFDDDSINGCESFTTLEINACYDMYYWWGTGTYVKYDRLVWAKDLKKIVLFGGSGTWYGYDCTILNDKFGDDYVIINLGINASMTNLFTMEFLSYYLNEDDILLWSPECGGAPLGITQLAKGDASFEREFSFTGYNYDNIKLIDLSKYEMVLSHFAIYNRNHIANTVSFEYSSSDVNCFGDSIGKRTTNNMKYNYSFSSVLTNHTRFENMANAISKIKENGAIVLYSFAPAQIGCASEEILKKYVQDMEEIFGVESISDYHNLLFEYELFHDSAWHLVNEGAEKRSTIVCEDLNAYLENNKK